MQTGEDIKLCFLLSRLTSKYSAIMTMNPGEMIKPPVEKDFAVKLIRELYGLRAKDVKEFNSYDDRNFFFKCEDYENPHVKG